MKFRNETSENPECVFFDVFQLENDFCEDDTVAPFFPGKFSPPKAIHLSILCQWVLPNGLLQKSYGIVYRPMKNEMTKPLQCSTSNGIVCFCYRGERYIEYCFVLGYAG
ncbi:hypothetical protein AVEN_12696-1 [Araneus ventricosus]|uniref:Uncharacterized protein n=1 Tax=Araneus ventricosus TaxID=182803 RepID=A0A4Y2ACS9_ARAVE|nr:hypothetical protein AVEN_12696-1 [Araneus ventricosus]